MTTGNRIFAVIVLYKCTIEQSKTFASLFACQDIINFEGIIYDNSPDAEIDFCWIPLGFNYIHNPENPGLAVAYNFALEQAKSKGHEWLLLLDQDTVLPGEYFESIKNLQNIKNVVAYIPTVKSETDASLIISPTEVKMGGFIPKLNAMAGIQENKISGINSGTLVKVDFMASIGNFNPAFPLDMLDHWYFREIYKKNKKIFLLDSAVYQNLSVSDIENNMSVTRYKNFIAVESLFFSTGSFVQNILYRTRLLFRTIKFLKLKDKSYSQLTIQKIFKFW